MTYTYDNTDLSTDLAKVRSAIGDVVEHEHYSLSDEEITANVTAASTLAVAKYLSARNRYSRAVIWSTRNAATVTADRNGVVQAMKDLCDKLEQDAGGQSAISVSAQGNIQVAAGMLSRDILNTAKQDSDYPNPPFRMTMDDNPWAVSDEEEDAW